MKTTILLAGLGGLMVAIGSVFGRGGAIIGLALGLLLVGFSYWKSDSLAIRAARAVPADEAQHPQYFATVRELAAKADMPMPKLYISQEQQPNAFATGRNPDHAAVAVTQARLSPQIHNTEAVTAMLQARPTTPGRCGCRPAAANAPGCCPSPGCGPPGPCGGPDIGGGSCRRSDSLIGGPVGTTLG